MIEVKTFSEFSHSPRAAEPTQPQLPLGLEPIREVFWVNGFTETRRRLFGRKVITELEKDKETGQFTISVMKAGDIDKILDPMLQSALRLADAAHAIGSTQDGPYCSSSHSVSILASNEGLHSRLISAQFTGIDEGMNDTFIQNLYHAAPDVGKQERM